MQQITGASGLTEASPVIMPTLWVPRSRQRAKNFSLTRALIGRGVVAAFAGGEGGELGGERDHRLARPGGRVEDHVVAGEQLDDGLLLGGVEGEVGVGGPVDEGIEDVVGGGFGGEPAEEGWRGRSVGHGREGPGCHVGRRSRLHSP